MAEPVQPELGDAVEPVPVEALPVEPLPVDPLPVEPLPVGGTVSDDSPSTPEWPSPLSDVHYASGGRVGPPGLVSAMGVCSIVVASIALLGGGFTTVVSLLAYSMLTRVAALATVVPTTAPTVAELVDPDGFTSADRATVAQGLARLRPLSAGQASQLDELLAEAGKRVVNTGGPPDPAVVAAGVTASGQLTSLGPTTGESPSFFLLATGRLELTDDRAVFFPEDGQPAVRAMAYPVPPPAADAVGPPPLSDDAIRSTLRAIARLNGGRPKAAQVTAVAAFLGGAAQQVVIPTTDGSDPACEVTSATTDAAGALTVATVHGTNACSLSVTPAGQMSAAMVPVYTPTVPKPNGAAVRAVALLSFAQLGLAAYLLVAGILTVRQARRGRLLHWLYVAVKIPAAIGAIVAGAWLWNSVKGGGGLFSPWAVPAGLGLIYCVVLVPVLATRSVREYYRAT